ncbi:unnamed protein product [Sympodiomycopsis kandeliae]
MSTSSSTAFASLTAPQGTFEDYAKHAEPLVLIAKPSAKSITTLDIKFTHEPSTDSEPSPLFRTKGNATKVFQAKFLDGDEKEIGTFRRKPWSWKNRFELKSPDDSNMIIESTSGGWKGYQTIQVVYTDTLSGRSESNQDAVLARVGRKRRAVLEAKALSPIAYLRDAETEEVLMTIEQKQRVRSTFNMVEPYTITIAPHFDTIIAASCFLMQHYIVVTTKAAIVS